MNRTIALLLIFLLATVPLLARELGLNECIDYALKNNIEIKNSQRAVKIAESEMLAAYGGFMPSIEVSGLNVLKESVSEMEIMGTTFEMDMLADYQYQLSGTEVLFAGGGIFFNIKNKAKEKEIAILSRDKAISNVIYDVSDGYYNLIYANLMRGLSEESIEILEKQMAMVRAQYDNGEASYLDLLQAKTELNNAIPDKIKANSMAKIALMSLKNILGLNETEDITVSSGYKQDNVQIIPEKSELYKLAVNNNHDLRILKCNENILKNTEMMAKGSYLPSLVLSGSYGQSKEEWGDEWDESYNISLALSWKIFDGFKRERNLSSVRYNRYIVEDNITDIRHKLSIDLSMKAETVKESDERMEAGETGLRLAEETLKMAQSSYEEGLIPLIELMQSRIGYNSAKASYIKAQYDYHLSLLKLKNY